MSASVRIISARPCRDCAFRRSELASRIFASIGPIILWLRRAVEENPKIRAQRRGAGYWVWKPYILLDTLNTVAEGTVVVYSDAGQRYVADPSPLIDLTATREVVLFHNIGGQLQRTWTKRDCFVLMQADAPEYWDASPARRLHSDLSSRREGTKLSS